MDQYNLNATFRYTTGNTSIIYKKKGADAFDYTVIADIGDLEPVTILVKMLGDIMRALKVLVVLREARATSTKSLSDNTPLMKPCIPSR